LVFTSVQYFVFFAAVVLFLVVVKNLKVQKLGLLLASYYFYSRWDWRFVGLVLGLTASTYLCVKMMRQSGSETARRRWLTTSIVMSLGSLAYFKYTNFFIDSVNNVLTYSHIQFDILRVVLPVGISFIVFEVISYAVDVYRGNVEYEDSLLDFAQLVAFFPHLIAGPILKPNHFLPQLKKPIRITAANLSAGSQLFVYGMMKKILASDRVAPFADVVFKHPGSFSPAVTWLAVIAYAIRIYGDFSGYTDMAIGSAKCLGFDIPRNFNLPYLSRNITEFWRCWHISLSTWLRDYLYFPLGGNRRGTFRTYANLAIVMLLGGLWHGASWNFVLWGGLHGAGLAVHKLLGNLKAWPTRLPHGVSRTVSWALTLLFVIVAWVPFRSPRFDTTLTILGRLCGFGSGHTVQWVSVSLLYALPCLALADFASFKWFSGRRLHLTRFHHLFAFFFMALMVLALAPPASSPFIYSRF
jgi:alginate O-acetyltransferase complex protein AlgI